MKTVLAVSLISTAMLAATPAHAGWKLIDHDEPVTVAKGDLQVTPGEDWNRWSRRPIKQSEVWTLDGVNLNELYFVSGIGAGETLFKDNQRRDRPLPQLAENAQLTDLPDYFESSSRLVLDTSLFEITSIEPTTLGGQDAVRFTYEYATQASPLQRKGVVVATLVDGALHMISFSAPAIYYFDRELPEFERIVASASL